VVPVIWAESCRFLALPVRRRNAKTLWTSTYSPGMTPFRLSIRIIVRRFIVGIISKNC
jgi:hypothetical protein